MANKNFIEIEDGGEFRVKYANDEEAENSRLEKDKELRQWWFQYIEAISGNKPDESFAVFSNNGMDMKARDGSSFRFEQEKTDNGFKAKIKYTHDEGTEFTQEAAEDMVMAGLQNGWKDISINSGSDEDKSKIWFAAQKLILQSRIQHALSGEDAGVFNPPFSVSGYEPEEGSPAMQAFEKFEKDLIEKHLQPIVDNPESLQDQEELSIQPGAAVDADSVTSLGKGKNEERFSSRAFKVAKSFGIGVATTLGAKVLLTAVVGAAFGAATASVVVPLAFTVYAGTKIARAVPKIRKDINEAQENHMGKGIGRTKAFMLAMKENAFHAGMLITGAVLTTVASLNMMPNILDFVTEHVEKLPIDNWVHLESSTPTGAFMVDNNDSDDSAYFYKGETWGDEPDTGSSNFVDHGDMDAPEDSTQSVLNDFNNNINGHEVSLDVQEAVHRAGSENPEIAAQATKDLAYFAFNGLDGVPQNDSLAAELFKQAADAGNIQAKTDLAYMQFSGLGGIEADPKAAMEVMKNIDTPRAHEFVKSWSDVAHNPQHGENTVPQSTGGNDTAPEHIAEKSEGADTRELPDEVVYMQQDSLFNKEIENIATSTPSNLDGVPAEIHLQAREIYLSEQDLPDLQSDLIEKERVFDLVQKNYDHTYQLALQMTDGDTAKAEHMISDTRLESAQNDFYEAESEYKDKLLEIEKMKMHIVLNGMPSGEMLYNSSNGLDTNVDMSEELKQEKMLLEEKQLGNILFSMNIGDIANANISTLDHHELTIHHEAQDYLAAEKEIARLEAQPEAIMQMYNVDRFNSISDSSAKILEEQYMDRVDGIIANIDDQKDKLESLREKLIEHGMPSGEDLSNQSSNPNPAEIIDNKKPTINKAGYT